MNKQINWPRNTDGMLESAKKKREVALDSTEKAIRQLIKENKPINFHTVAEAANVSVPWLYKEIEIKERIQQLREQQKLKIKLDEGRQPSEASSYAMITALKKRIKQQDEEIDELKKQLKKSYGLIRHKQELIVIAEALETRNTELEKEKNHISNLLTQARAEIDWLKSKSSNAKFKVVNKYNNSDDQLLPKIDF